MTIIFACDHAGFVLKQKLINWLGAKSDVVVIDVGATTKNKKDDYPIFAYAGAQAVKDTKNAKGIFICGSGVGMAITANRVARIRAVHAESSPVVRRARQEDDVNVLVLGARIITNQEAKKLVTIFLKTKFSHASRHSKRVHLIDRISS